MTGSEPSSQVGITGGLTPPRPEDVITGSRRLWRSPWRRDAGWLCAYLAIAVFASWPLCRSPASTISIGFEAEATVPLLNVWTLWWNSDRLAAGFHDYWNAPIFYPTRGTFAFSEAQPTMLIAAPVVWLTGSRVLAYNVYLLLILSLNGWSSQRLFRRIGHQPWLAFCGGVMCQMLPFVWWQSGVVQLMTVFGIVSTVHSLLDVFDPPMNSIRGATWQDMASTVRGVSRFLTAGFRFDCPLKEQLNRRFFWRLWLWFDQGVNWRDSSLRGLKLGGSFCVTYLLCNYWGMFLVLLLVPGSIWLWNASVFRLRFWFEIEVAALVAVAVLGPMVWVQRSLAAEHKWTREQSLIRELSAHPRDFLDTPRTARAKEFGKPGIAQEPATTSDDNAIAWTRIPRLEFAEPARENLWPLGGGTLKLALAHVGLLAALVTRGRRRWGLFAATFAVVSFGLSLGPTVWIAPWVPVWNDVCPYEWLQQHVPGFALIRSPFRFALFFQLAIVWLSVEALDLLNPGRWRHPPQNVRRIMVHPALLNPPPSAASIVIPWILRGLLVLQSLILVGEVWPPRQSRFTCPSATTVPAWILWLRENSDPTDAVVCLPFPTGYTVHDYEGTAVWMYWGTMHLRPLVNGYSGFFPQDFQDLKEKLAYFHRPEGDPAPIPRLKMYPEDSPGLKDLNKWHARFAIVQRSFATRDDVWQHPLTRYRWAWVTGDEQHQLDVYEIQPE